jgi:hypothetical protein
MLYCQVFVKQVCLLDQGDVRGSVVEFDKALELDPQQKPCEFSYLYICRYLHGRYISWDGFSGTYLHVSSSELQFGYGSTCDTYYKD